MRDGNPGFKPLSAVLLGGFLLAGCIQTTAYTDYIKPGLNKAQTAIQGAFDKYGIEVEPTQIDDPLFEAK